MLETATALESSVASSCRELLPRPTPVPTRSPSLTTVSRRCQRDQAKRFSGTNCVNRISTRHRDPVSFVTLLVVKQLRATFRCSSTTGWDVPISHGQRRRVGAVNLRIPEAETRVPARRSQRTASYACPPFRSQSERLPQQHCCREERPSLGPCRRKSRQFPACHARWPKVHVAWACQPASNHLHAKLCVSNWLGETGVPCVTNNIDCSFFSASHKTPAD